MSAMLETLSAWMPDLLRTSARGAVLVAVILVVQWALGKRLSPAWRHGLWALLIVRLVLIWAPASPISVYNLAVRDVPAVVEAPAEHRSASVEPVAREMVPATETFVNDQGAQDVAARESALRSFSHVAGESRIRAAAVFVWLAGFGGLLLAMLGQSLHFGRQVRRGRFVTNSNTLELLEECRLTLRVSTFLALVETDCVRSPALLGCIRPKLLLPCGFLDSLSREEMRHVLLHELAHVKRGDIWSGWVFNLVAAAHWFNPAVWIARKRFIADREAACDARVLAALDAASQRDYGHTVLNLTQRFNASSWAPGMAGISESNSNLKRRITMIKQFRPPTRLAAWSGAGLCLCIGLATLTNAQEVKPKAAPAAVDQPEPTVEPPRIRLGGQPVENAVHPVPAGPKPGGGNTNLAQNGGGDIVCEPSDIYGYTATNGGSMIAAQLTNTGTQDITVDVEFSELEAVGNSRIGRGGVIVPAGKTATEAIPWVVENGNHIVSITIDPDKTTEVSNESNNQVHTLITYTDGRFKQGSAEELEEARRVIHSIHAVRVEATRRGLGLATRPYSDPAERTPGQPRGGHASEGSASCQTNLKSMGLTFKMWANESTGERFPILSQTPGKLMFAWGDEPIKLGDDYTISSSFDTGIAALLTCPDSGHALLPPDDTDFVYLGYVVQNDEDIHAFEDAYISHIAATEADSPRFQGDLPDPSNPQRGILRIREGAERFFITDINDPAASARVQSHIPLLIEWPEHHVDENGNKGGHVLFMDGHVEFMPYPGKWPMTEETMKVLCELAGREPIK